MKQKDIALVVLIGGIAAAISFFASHAIFASASNRTQQAEVVDPISTTFIQPSSKYFNEGSVNPTQLIQIGGSNNENPFGSSQ